jgi:hypothetical protein
VGLKLGKIQKILAVKLKPFDEWTKKKFKSKGKSLILTQIFNERIFFSIKVRDFSFFVSKVFFLWTLQKLRLLNISSILLHQKLNADTKLCAVLVDYKIYDYLKYFFSFFFTSHSECDAVITRIQLSGWFIQLRPHSDGDGNWKSNQH